MANAGISSLISQAAISLIDNQGDIGKTLTQLGSLNTVKAMALSMAEAGALSEIGTLTNGHFTAAGVTQGGGLTPMRYLASGQGVENVLGHAAVGCAAGMASGGSCGSNAAAAALSDAASPLTIDAGFAGGTALSAGIGAGTSAITGGSAAIGAITSVEGYLYNSRAGRIAGRIIGGRIGKYLGGFLGLDADGILAIPGAIAGEKLGQNIGGTIGDLATGSDTPTAPPVDGATPPTQNTPEATLESWGNPASLTRHFADHGVDFGATSAEDYASQASQFLKQSQTGGLPTKIDPNGTIRTYDPASNTFGSYNANGTTKTFFKPTSPTYFDRQPGVSPTILGGH